MEYISGPILQEPTMTHGTPVTTVTVRCVETNGRYLVYSDDVPGLHVWAESEEQLCERVAKGIKLLFKWNRKLDVEVLPASDPETFPNVPRLCDRFVIAARV